MQKQLVAIGISRNGQPYTMTAVQRRPADWPTDEEIDRLGNWTWPEPVDARDDAQYQPRQEQMK